MKKVDEIKIGGTYCIDWEGAQRTVNVKSIEKSDESIYDNLYYVNGNVKIDFSNMTVKELDDNDKVKWCRENCCGCDYCGGCKEDGSKCEYAPSIEVIKKEMGIN